MGNRTDNPPPGDSGTCWYCERAGQVLVPCCGRHPDRMVCADVEACRDVLLAELQAQYEAGLA